MFRHLPTVALAVATIAAALPAQAREDRDRNVLWVMMDDVGVWDMAAYGATDPARTPTIDALAASGVVFERCWSMPVCSPTRATILTGTYPFQHGVSAALGHKAKFGLSALDGDHLPSLWPNHYRTALIGKWHVSPTTRGAPFHGGPRAPLEAGFDHHSGIMFNISETLGESYTHWPKVEDGVPLGLQSSYVTSDQIDSAVRWIRRQEGPWFCMLSLSAAHEPFEAPPAHLASLPANPTDRDRYLAMVEAIDTELGRLLAEIGDDVLAETTVFVFGDNGTPLPVAPPELGVSQAKTTTQEGGIRVPLIVSGRGVPGGRRVPDLVGLIDLWATAADLAGVPVQRTGGELRSASILPLIHGRGPGPTERKRWQYSEYYTPLGQLDASKRNRWLRAISDGRWKLIELNGKRTLFDLDNDPLETVDEYKNAQHATVRKALEAAMIQHFGGKSPLGKNLGAGQ